MASKASPAATIRQGCAGLWVRPACLSVVAVMRIKNVVRSLNHPRNGALAWKVQLWSSNRPRYRHQPWKVQLLNPEPSVIRAQSVEGSRLDTEPSMIRGINVEGSNPDTRTVRDSGPKRGRFRGWAACKNSSLR